ncbi:type II secretion system protein GspD [Candidatus Dependentiae bacterium]|nr:type II secretion system protein GspD [Candidatus Dependentiae bacterium]
MKRKTFLLVLLILLFAVLTFGIEKKITINAKDTEILEILRILSQQAGVNIVPDASVKGKISINLKDVTLEVALKRILEANGYTYQKKGNMYLVSTPKRKGGKLNITSDGYNLSCDIKSADLKEVLNEIADKAEINIVIHGTLVGTVDARLTDVTLQEGIELLLGGTKYTLKVLDNIYIIGDSSLTSPAASILSSSSFIIIDHLKAEDVVEVLSDIVPNIKVKVLKEGNAILLVGSSQDILKAIEYIDLIDIPTPVVMIEAIIVEYKAGITKDYGFSTIGKTGNFTEIEFQPGSTATATGGIISGSFDKEAWESGQFSAFLKALETENKAKIIAKPHISTLSGHEAEINVGCDQYFEVTTGNVETPLTSLEKIQTGVILKLKATVTGNDEIILELHPEVSDFIPTSGSGKTATSKKKANTVVRVKDGDIIVIGGLIKRDDTFAEDRFPIAGKIPILGYFFRQFKKKDEGTELVFYIRPHIVKNDDSERIYNEEIKPKSDIELKPFDYETITERKDISFMKNKSNTYFITGLCFSLGGYYLNREYTEKRDIYEAATLNLNSLRHSMYNRKTFRDSSYTLAGISFIAAGYQLWQIKQEKKIRKSSTVGMNLTLNGIYLTTKF